MTTKDTALRLALEALEQIQHSVKQARVVGNDWRRELELIENTASDAIRNLIGNVPLRGVK